MTKSSHLLRASALACFAALSACGSKGPGGSSGSGSNGPNTIDSACLGPSFSSACDSCLQSSCGSTLGSFVSNCNDYIECYCPNGAYSASAQTSQTCVSKAAMNPSCISSVTQMNNCVTQTCAGSCGASGSGSGSSGGVPGGSGSTGGSGGTGGSTAACGVVFTKPSCASCVMTNCCSVTQACAKDQSCMAIISCIHQCNGTAMCEQNCVGMAPSSAQTELFEAGDCWSSSCSKSGC